MGDQPADSRPPADLGGQIRRHGFHARLTQLAIHAKKNRRQRALSDSFHAGAFEDGNHIPHVGQALDEADSHLRQGLFHQDSAEPAPAKIGGDDQSAEDAKFAVEPFGISLEASGGGLLNLCQPRIEHGDERWLFAALGYRYLNESTQGDDYDLTGNAVVARLAMPMPHELLFEFSGQWTWEDYWQPNTQDYRRRNRDDFIQRYIWSLSRDFEIDRNIIMTLRGEISWTEDDSNIRNRLKEAVFSYDRVIYGLTLSFFFN